MSNLMTYENILQVIRRMMNDQDIGNGHFSREQLLADKIFAMHKGSEMQPTRLITSQVSSPDQQ
jgi:hypothetical protein